MCRINLTENQKRIVEAYVRSSQDGLSEANTINIFDLKVKSFTFQLNSICLSASLPQRIFNSR